MDASDEDFARVIGSAPVPVVIDFWGAWCAPSRQLEPVFEQMATALAGRAKLVRVNVEDTPQLVLRYGVQSLPTLLAVHRGRAIARKSGAAQAPEFRDWVEEALRRSVNAAATDR
ncbi:MAG: thioredoxin domain-containing protein [Microbacterium sp.]